MITPNHSSHRYANMAAGYGTTLLAYDIARGGGPEKVLPGCTTGELQMDVGQYRRMLTGSNGAHVVGLFKVAIDAHLLGTPADVFKKKIFATAIHFAVFMVGNALCACGCVRVPVCSCGVCVKCPMPRPSSIP